MRFGRHLVILRGGGDLGTGAAARLWRAGFPVVVAELAHPLAIRRQVAVAAAVSEGEVRIEDLTARRARDPEHAVTIARGGDVAVLVSPELPGLAPEVVVDARMAKRNLGTTRAQAPLVIGLGPGFTAGVDCHAVVETKRGHHLGRVFWEGRAAADTGEPGTVGGKTAERVVRAPAAGTIGWDVEIGDVVSAGQRIGDVDAAAVVAPIAGVVRGLIAPGSEVAAGLKVADVDPRGDARAAFEISDKALAVGGGVLEAVLTHLRDE